MQPTFYQTYTILRQLAKDQYWQSIYCQSKECSGIQLFENNCNYTYLQITFLNEMAKFSNICTDVLLGEVSDLVLSEEIYQNAYIFYKHNQRMKKNKSKSSPSTTTNKKKNAPSKEILNQNQWVFTKVKGSK